MRKATSQQNLTKSTTPFIVTLVRNRKSKRYTHKFVETSFVASLSLGRDGNNPGVGKERAIEEEC
jgi:hypothetical protein